MNAIEAVLVMLILIGTGVLIFRLGWVNDQVMTFLSKTVVTVALPCSMFYTFLNDYSRDKLLEIFPLVPLPFVTIALSLVLARTLAHFVVPEGRRGVFTAMVGFSNTIFIGLPVNQLLLGAAGVPYALVVYIATTVLYWTAGAALIASDGPRVAHPQWWKEAGAIARRLFLSPPIVALVVSVTLVMVGLKAPAVIMESTRYIGNLTTPLSMIFVGISVAQSDLRELRLDRSTVLVTLGRFVFTPGLLLGVLAVAGALGVHPPKLAVAAFFVQATMPTMAQTAILARASGSDHGFASRITVLTTLLCLVIIPVVYALLETFVL